MSRQAGAIHRLANSVCAVERRLGAYVDGRWEFGASERFEMLGSFQPLSGASLVRAPEGQRTSERAALFTEEPLRTADEGAATPADLVTVSGRAYEVRSVEAWGSFWRCVLEKMQP
jgi:hypothetical protein